MRTLHSCFKKLGREHMSDFWFYFKIGLRHVLDWQAYDHMLFFLVLVARHVIRDWKSVLSLVTVFTLGHMFSMTLSVYNVIKVDSGLTEFLIPVTILFTAVNNMVSGGAASKTNRSIVLLITAFFGLIHGLGFSSYFKMISSNLSSKGIPLVSFGLGIEAAQGVVVVLVLLLGVVVQNFFRVSRRDWILVLSAIVIGLVLPILVENRFW